MLHVSSCDMLLRVGHVTCFYVSVMSHAPTCHPSAPDTRAGGAGEHEEEGEGAAAAATGHREGRREEGHRHWGRVRKWVLGPLQLAPHRQHGQHGALQAHVPGAKVGTESRQNPMGGGKKLE